MRVIRSFLALKLNLATADNLASMQAELREACADADIKVRWVPPPNMHVTLRFLGQITEPMSHALKDMLDPIVSRMPAFDLECAGIGVFPDGNKPKVIYAGLGSGSEALNELYESVYSRLLMAGFSFEDKPFRPHVTIGRVKYSPKDALTPILSPFDGTFFGTSLIRHFYCYQSDLTSLGAEYRAQWVLSFKRQPMKSPQGQNEPEPNSKHEETDNTIEPESPQPPQTGE
jgi:RNA 2',3'-cyclic 3'-phosphodiesterase